MVPWFAALAVAGPFDSDLTPDDPLHVGPRGGPDVPPTAIVGGVEAAPDAWPEVGAFLIRDLFRCTSVLVAPDLVVSAGHCETAGSIERFVILGTTDYTVGGERLAVTQSWRPADYLERFDIALFELERDAAVEPVPLLWACEVDEALYDGVEATVVGFGATDLDAEQTTTLLHEATVFVEDADCSDLERGCRATVSPGGELRAGADDADTCVGDSGGPLYVDTANGRRLAGITSRSALPASTECGNGGLYVRADALVEWIEAETGRALPRPACAEREPDPPAPPPTNVTPDTGCETGPRASWLALGLVLLVGPRRTR